MAQEDYSTPHIIQSQPSQEYYFKEGCYILELSNSNTDPQLSIARVRVLPNTQTKLHQLSQTIERYVILEGQGEVILGSSITGQHMQCVKPNDVVIIPENCPQAIKNNSDSDLIFLAICTPRFEPINYSETSSAQT